MALQAALAQLCPQTDVDNGHHVFDCNLFLSLRSGEVIPCHSELVRARCTQFPEADDNNTVNIDADAPVVYVLLGWVYSEALDLPSVPYQKLTSAVVCLGLSWGLRDCTVLQDRLMSSWRKQRRAGTLLKDIARAYDSGAWGKLYISSPVDDSGERAAELSGGWVALLRGCSSYFKAMLGGEWVESSGSSVKIHWPRTQLAKLLRFLHGHCFVESAADLPAAMECSDFFGVPALVAEANDWVAANLKLENAAALWDFVHKEPRMCINNIDDQVVQAVDASSACLDFFLRNFAELARDPQDGDGSWVPLHDLSCPLMQKLLATGLLEIPHDELMHIVYRYALAKCGSLEKSGALLSSLRPPVVMFNREMRDLLTGNIETSIRAVL